MNDPFGFLIIDKPKGFTSHDCVNKIRKVFGIKRVGHGGTLDPNVTGVLPIAVGQATRLFSYLPSDKHYKGIIQLGTRTTSDDSQGEVISIQAWPELAIHSLEQHLNKYRGEIQQCPPKISSVHIKGMRAYQRARKGETFDLPQRTIYIHQLQLLKWDQALGQIKIYIHCSSGTYIRALARDLGNDLGCGGCLTMLRRTQALGFHENQAFRLPTTSSEESSIKSKLLSPLQALKHLPQLQLTTEEELMNWRTGRKSLISIERVQNSDQSMFPNHQQNSQFTVVRDPSDQMIGIGDWNRLLELQPKIVFNAFG